MDSLNCAAKFAIAVILILIVRMPAFAEDMSLPSGWRMPIGSELNDDWRNKDADKFAVVRGDFNGDGIVDKAMLLVSLRGNGFGLFVFLSQKNHTFRACQLDVIKDPSFLRVMGIDKVSSGKYKTVCGKGYWDCKKGEVPEILVEHDAISYFKTESASSYFYWGKRAKIFRRIWISD
jgi:hypothetical protein